MAARKKIGLITICPEDDYQQRVINGIFSQCEKLDYDVVVFSSLVKISSFYKDYLEGELNIYELINFDLLDGIIITPVPMTEDRTETLTNHLLEKIKKECKIPVVSLDLSFGGYKTVYTDDASAIECITSHIIEKHSCTNICMLTGMKDYPISEVRVKGYREALEKHGIAFKESNVFYGDFWYTSGIELAERFVKKELPLPEAVVCASDYMAMGLTNELIKNGVKVPGQVIVTGYEATREASINTPPITSFKSDVSRTGAMAVEKLHRMINPEAKKKYIPFAGEKNLCIGGTCGCQENVEYTRTGLKGGQYSINQFNGPDMKTEGIDVGQLLESYMTEILTGTVTPEQCLQKIYESIYLLKPYGYFYLCLDENWLNTDKDKKKGYSDKMHLVIYSDMAKKLHGYPNHVFFGPDRTKSFPTKKMLPALASDEFEKPQVFYFTPVHFNSIELGYAVLQNDLSLSNKIGPVYRNYLRNINNALEMSRAKNRIANISEHDMMTDLYNRRGMERLAEEMLQKAKDNERTSAKWLCFVIDMDGLKMINDTFGHSEGDAGIIMVSDALRAMSDDTEVCVRGGGDEFYLLGLGDYTKEIAEKKRAAFQEALDKLNKNCNTTLPVAASIGYAIEPAFENQASDDSGLFDAPLTYEQVLERADVQMYLDKRSKKTRR